MRGNDKARHRLGLEENSGNTDRALKHHLVATGAGHKESLKIIRELYTDGHATKDDYTAALRARQDYSVEVKRAQRDEAAAFEEYYKY
jgi:NRPS condensation-like uncharacterized protein